MEAKSFLRAAVLWTALMLPIGLQGDDLPSAWKEGRFTWDSSGPLLDAGPGRDASDPQLSIKDPSIVFHEGRWHLFVTMLTRAKQVQIQYLNFADWPEAASAPRTTLALGDKFYAAPQVFYFTPHRRWYLICQTEEDVQPRTFRASFSTTENLADPKSWTKMESVLPANPPGKVWIDYWVICDERKAHLFYATLDGKLWRRETALTAFPRGWSEPMLTVEGEIFEAPHVYKLKGREQYLTIVEALIPGRRYYKAYLADRLEGPWRGLADSLAKPFASRENVRQSPVWTASVSHGELIRTGIDERLEVDPENLRFLYQGVSEADYQGAKYHNIPWRLGILRLAR